ncbi:MAG: hypothetical protein J0H21_06355, partial [Rhizobiales bacterium]|nr:hypothetical protein [Hyphomicrobiales bacterium]
GVRGPGGARMSGEQTEGWMRRLGHYLGRHRRNVTIAVVAAVLGAACQVTTPLMRWFWCRRLIMKCPLSFKGYW